MDTQGCEEGSWSRSKWAKVTFMEAKKSWVEASTSKTHENFGGNNEAQDIDPSLLATFLKTCMKLLQDRKVVEGLQDLIDKCTGKVKNPPDERVIQKVGKRKK